MQKKIKALQFAQGIFQRIEGWCPRTGKENMARCEMKFTFQNMCSLSLAMKFIYSMLRLLYGSVSIELSLHGHEI